MDDAEFLPQDTAPPVLLLLTVQSPRIWFLASRESVGIGRRGECRDQSTLLGARPKLLVKGEATVVSRVLCSRQSTVRPGGTVR